MGSLADAYKLSHEGVKTAKSRITSGLSPSLTHKERTKPSKNKTNKKRVSHESITNPNPNPNPGEPQNEQPWANVKEQHPTKQRKKEKKTTTTTTSV